jgi:hypothetical protein
MPTFPRGGVTEGGFVSDEAQYALLLLARVLYMKTETPPCLPAPS